MDGIAQAKAETADQLRRRKRREFVARIRWYIYLAYCRTLYRPLMRTIHRIGWCQMTPMPQIDAGPPRYWCQWCGMRGSR